MRNQFILFLLLCPSIFTVSASDRIIKSSAFQPGFVENAGQIKTQDGQVNNEILFQFSSGAFNLQLKQHSFSFEIFTIQNSNGFAEYGETRNESIPFGMQSHRIDVRIVESNETCQVQGEEPTGAVVHYLKNGENRSAIKAFEKIRYTNIYEGVDLVFIWNHHQQELKYQWELKAGIDPSIIRLTYSGADGMFLTSDGALTLLAMNGQITESRPISFYIDGENIPSAYKFSATEIRYELRVDGKRNYVIDPGITWITYFGGSELEEVNEVTVDGNERVIYAGNTVSTANIASAGAHQTVYGGGDFDAFMACFTNYGVLLWATYYGGEAQDYGRGVFSDPLNNIILVGSTHSETGIATPGSHQDTLFMMGDMFIAKFLPSGELVWSTYFGGENGDQLRQGVADAEGNLYVVGYSESNQNISTPFCYQPNQLGAQEKGDAVIAKFSADGARIWATYYSGLGQDRAHAVTLDKLGRLLIVGTCESLEFIAVGNSHQDEYGGGVTDAFLASFDTTGFPNWSTYYGGAWEEHGRGVKVDQYNNVYMIGYTTSEENMATASSHQPYWFPAFGGIDSTRGEDAFMAKFSSSGNRIWGTYFGGDANDFGRGLTIDTIENHIFLGGATSSTVNISTEETIQSEVAGSSDIFLTKFSYNGQQIWGTYIGSDETDELEDVEFRNNSLYLGAYTESDLPATFKSYQRKYAGNGDALFLKVYAGNDCFDPHEPNNNFETASYVSMLLDSTLWGFSGTLSMESDTDFYSFNSRLIYPYFKIVATSLPANFNLYLYDKNFQLLAQSENTGITDEEIYYTISENGKYYIAVTHPADTFSANQCYRLLPMAGSASWMKQGQQAEQLPFEVALHPNPARERFFVQVHSQVKSRGQIRLTGILQDVLLEKQVEIVPGTSQFEFNLPILPAGIYQVHVICGNKKTVSPLILH